MPRGNKFRNEDARGRERQAVVLPHPLVDREVKAPAQEAARLEPARAPVRVRRRWRFSVKAFLARWLLPVGLLAIAITYHVPETVWAYVQPAPTQAMVQLSANQTEQGLNIAVSLASVNGQALAHTSVRMEVVAPDGTLVQVLRTDDAGRAALAIPARNLVLGRSLTVRATVIGKGVQGSATLNFVPH